MSWYFYSLSFVVGMHCPEANWLIHELFDGLADEENQ